MQPSYYSTCPLDPIPTNLLQSITPSVTAAITHVINTLLTSGTFSTTFKQAQITPLLKKPSLAPTQVENYWPGLSPPVPLQLSIERGVFKQITEFLSQNNFLDPNQFGFKSGNSTGKVLLTVIEALKEVRAAAKSSVLILLDLSAVFHTVNHRILLSILSNMGITGKAHTWLESYLTGQSFNVSWLGHTSVQHVLVTGAPQG